MAKKKENPLTYLPIEKMYYGQRFTLDADTKHTTWALCDFCEQSVTDAGELCPDKPIRIRSDTGVEERLAWGTLVLPVKEEVTPNLEPAEPHHDIGGEG